MVKKSTVRLDDARFPREDIYSVRAAAPLENGFVGRLGEVEAGNPDIRTLAAPVAGDGDLVLIANPAINYDQSRMGANKEDQYEMAAGEAVRAYGLRKSLVFAVAKEGINGTPVVGEYLVAGAGHKLVPAATAPLEGFAAKIVRIDKVGGKLSLNAGHVPTEFVVVEVVAN